MARVQERAAFVPGRLPMSAADRRTFRLEHV